MGNSCDRYCCFGRYSKRKYLRTRYNVERDFSIEFENLMDEDQGQQEEMNRAVTPRERLLLSNKQYGTYIEEQKQRDAEIDAQLVQQEEELRMEEEAYYEARREAARAVRRQREGEGGHKSSCKAITRPNTKQWIGEEDSDWEVTGGEEDFEVFLESVKARSLAARTRALPSQVAVDQQSTSSVASKEKTDDATSSIDLEWEHEAGMLPLPKKDKRAVQSRADEKRKISELAVRPNMLHLKGTHELNLSNEFEWDSDIGENETGDVTEDSENVTLLSHNGERTKR